jgi:3-dehydroquinate dehydratase-2
MNITIINGANLNLLGVREPDIYGKTGFDSYLDLLRTGYQEIKIDYFQSNIEGELVNKLQQSGFTSDGIILNAGGYTHTSVAIADAIAAISSPVVEVHLSNIYAREEFRRHSLLSSKVRGVISGLGLDVYELALLHLCRLLKINS